MSAPYTVATEAAGGRSWTVAEADTLEAALDAARTYVRQPNGSRSAWINGPDGAQWTVAQSGALTRVR